MDWTGDRRIDFRVDLVDADGGIIVADLPVDSGQVRGDLSAASMWVTRTSPVLSTLWAV